jgi:hypothetical protein
MIQGFQEKKIGLKRPLKTGFDSITKIFETLHSNYSLSITVHSKCLPSSPTVHCTFLSQISSPSPTFPRKQFPINSLKLIVNYSPPSQREEIKKADETDTNVNGILNKFKVNLGWVTKKIGPIWLIYAK